MTMRNPKWRLRNTFLVHTLNLVAHCIINYMETLCDGLVVSMHKSGGIVTCCDAHMHTTTLGNPSWLYSLKVPTLDMKVSTLGNIY